MAAIEQWRGAQREAIHPIAAVAVGGGQVVRRMGPEVTTPWRSAAKPFQLATCLDLLGDPDVSDEMLAVGAASHSGEPRHLELVREILARWDLDESDLLCGAQAPSHVPSYEALLRGGGVVGNIHNNCSGKHGFMLAAARSQGGPGDYRPRAHPVQVRIAEDLARWSGHEPGAAVDGCGVPTWCQPLSALARAWQALACAYADGEDQRLGRVARAMGAHPHLTSGTGRLDADVMAGALEPMVVKVGAMGVFCMALPARKMGIALKMVDGNGPARGEATAALLAAWAPGAWRRPATWPWQEVRNCVGDLVGDYRFLPGDGTST